MGLGDRAAVVFARQTSKFDLTPAVTTQSILPERVSVFAVGEEAADVVSYAARDPWSQVGEARQHWVSSCWPPPPTHWRADLELLPCVSPTVVPLPDPFAKDDGLLVEDAHRPCEPLPDGIRPGDGHPTRGVQKRRLALFKHDARSPE